MHSAVFLLLVASAAEVCAMGSEELVMQMQGYTKRHTLYSKVVLRVVLQAHVPR
jgi:hypothetical protein